MIFECYWVFSERKFQGLCEENQRKWGLHRLGYFVKKMDVGLGINKSML